MEPQYQIVLYHIQNTLCGVGVTHLQICNRCILQPWPNRGRIDTAVWMHYMDDNKTVGEEVRQQLHKNVASNIEQVLTATPHKAPTIRPPITKTIQARQTRHAGHCWRSRDELISDELLWTPTYGRAKGG